jgi:hypothetical protein
VIQEQHTSKYVYSSFITSAGLLIGFDMSAFFPQLFMVGLLPFALLMIFRLLIGKKKFMGIPRSNIFKYGILEHYYFS